MPPINIDAAAMDGGARDLSDIVLAFLATGRVYRHDVGWACTKTDSSGTSVTIYPRPDGPATAADALQVFNISRQDARGRETMVALGGQAPYRRVINDALESAAQLFPHVEGVYRLPTMMRNSTGLIQACGGFHNQRLYTGQPLPPGQPSPDYPHLLSLFSAYRSSMPYAPHYTNLLCYVVAMWARPEFDKYPLLIVDGLRRNIGKTSILEAIGWILNGAPTSLLSFTKSEEQFERLLAGHTNRPGPVYLPFDNIKARRGGSLAVRSQALCISTTSRFVNLRGAHEKSAARLEYPIFAFSMNRAVVENDLHDRAIKILLGGESNAFLSPFPPEYAQAHYPALRHECFALLEGLRLDDHTLRLAAGSPARYFDWANIMYQVAARLRAVDPTLAPLDLSVDSYDTCDGLIRDLVSIVEGLHEENNAWPRMVQVVEYANKYSSREVHQELSQWLYETGQTSPKAQAAMLRGEVVAPSQRRSLWKQGKKLALQVDNEDRISYTLQETV